MMKPQILPSVSIVLTVLNVESTITECLESLVNVDYPKDKMEIIVVDGGSVDSTVPLLKKFPIKVMVDPKGNISSGRNKGIRQSSGEIVAITDGDMTVSKDWLTQLVKHFSDPKVGCVGGPILTHPKSNKFATYVGLLPEESPRFNSVQFVPHDMIYTRNAAYRREALLSAGLFDERLVAAEDLDLNWRIEDIGYKLVFTPHAKVWHRHRQNLWSFIKQHWRNGIGCGQLAKKNLKIRKTGKRILCSLAFILTILNLCIHLLSGHLLPLTIFLVSCIAFLTMSIHQGCQVYKDTRRITHLLVTSTLTACWYVFWLLGFLYGLSFRKSLFVKK